MGGLWETLDLDIYSELPRFVPSVSPRKRYTGTPNYPAYARPSSHLSLPSFLALNRQGTLLSFAMLRVLVQNQSLSGEEGFPVPIHLWLLSTARWVEDCDLPPRCPEQPRLPALNQSYPDFPSGHL